MRKTILSILVVASFLALAALPSMASEEKVITIMKGEENKNLKDVTTTLTVASIDADAIVTKIDELKAWFEETRPFKDLQLTEEEKNEIRTRVNEVIAPLNALLEANNLDPITTDWIYTEMFALEGKSTIATLGRGYAFIPFYDYETFLGVMLRPMWFLYPPLWLGGGGGYTGNFNVNFLPPRIEYGDRLGPHMVRTTAFTGLYVNIGDLGYNNIFSGTIILLGRARVVM